MNFLNFLTSKASLFNFNLLSQSSTFQRENTILVEPTQENGSNTSAQFKQFQPNEPSRNEMQPEAKQKEDLPGEISQLLTQQQMLINQYMELKLKYLASCLNLNQGQIDEQCPPLLAQDKQTTNSLQNKEDQNSALKKKIKKRNKCGHEDKNHYAKGMCNNCYHKYGRTKKPWNCSHDKLYAAGMCQNCYINNYNRKKREEKEFDKEQPEKCDIQSCEPEKQDDDRN